MKRVGCILLAMLLLSGCGSKAPASTAPHSQPRQPVSASEKAVVASSVPSIQPPPVSSSSEPEPQPDESDILEIQERLFLAQINDIYLNPDEYVGKTIRYQAIYMNNLEWAEEGQPIVHFVIRYAPGCCGDDGQAGFEVRWNGEYPEMNDWVEVVGVLKQETFQSGFKIIYLELLSITVQETRGKEFVDA